ncbi:helix-turn-helix domain-containing protein [Zunongwangia sp.]|uniref:helix-turn-helix domain-containing protein n=1 Tax=Zunongwangia sp. TaxID=1965325 RepID=UPI003AA9CEA7
MKKYRLEIKNVDDFIPEIAKIFDIGYKNSLGEYAVNVPSVFGAGQIRGINFPNGIGLYNIRVNFKEKISFHIYHNWIKPIRFIYCIGGEICTGLGNSNTKSNLLNHQHLIAAPEAEDYQYLEFEPDKEIVLCYLEIDRNRFKDYLSFDLHEIESTYFQIFADVNSKNSIFKTGTYGLQTLDLIKSIEDCRLSGFPRINFLGGKALEILAYLLVQFKNDETYQESRVKKRDLIALERAVDHINKNIRNIGTVQRLAKISGVNVNKLQDGFQEIYGKTVNAYIRDIRLNLAMNMLIEGEKSVGEIVYELGLSSRSYFSKIFKRKYGLLPKHVLNKSNYKEVSE